MQNKDWKLRPETPKEYILQTEHAVRHLYEGIDSCWAYYQEAEKYWDISKFIKEDNNTKSLVVDMPRTPENLAALNKYLELARKYFSLKFSEGTFAGSILQIAAMGIQYFSQNEVIPESCKDIVLPNSKAVRFCIGKEVYGIPEGLIIYAARNQYNHWDEEILKDTVNIKVFNHLALQFRDNVLADLAFSLGNPTIIVYANEVLLTALKWTTYEKYLSEMEDILRT